MDDATQSVKEDIASPAALAVVLAGIFKGEEEDFARRKFMDGFSYYKPVKAGWKRWVETVNCPAPQPGSYTRADDPGSHEDPEICIIFKHGFFYQESIDCSEVALLPDSPGTLPYSSGHRSKRRTSEVLAPANQPRRNCSASKRRAAMPTTLAAPPSKRQFIQAPPSEDIGVSNRSDSAPRTDTMPIPPPEVSSPEVPPEIPQPKTLGAFSATNSEVESIMHYRWRKTSLRHPVIFDQEFNVFNSMDAYFGAARVGLEDAAGVLSNSLQTAREKIKKLFEEL